MSERLARFLYRRRRLLTAAILLGAVALLPRVNITRINNDLSSWFSREDPVYREYERFQEEFGGTRTLIVAIQAPSRARLFTREAFEMLDAIGEDIERVPAVERVATLASATLVDARPAAGTDPGAAASAEHDAVLHVRPLIDDLASKSPEALGERALDDDLLRGDLDFRRRHRDVGRRLLRRAPRRRRPGGGHRGDQRDRQGAAAGGLPRLRQRQPRDQRDLQPDHAREPDEVHAADSALHGRWRSSRCSDRGGARCSRSARCSSASSGRSALYDLFGFSYNVLSSMIVPLVIVLAIADDVHIMQHYRR